MQSTHHFASARRWLVCIGLLSLPIFGAVQAATLSVSASANRSNATNLQGATLAESTNVYIFGVNETGLQQVRFYLDRAATGTPDTNERYAPFDFAGTAASGNANPFNTSALSTGSHTLNAIFNYQNGSSQTVSATFAVGSGTPPPPPPPPPPSTYSLQLSPNADRSNAVPLEASVLSANAAYIFLGPSTGVRRVDFYLDAAAAPMSSEGVAPFDFAHTAPNNVALPWNPTTVADGAHSIRAVITPTSGAQQTVTAGFTVSTLTDPPPDPDPTDRCAPVICNQIRVTLPYTLEFNTDAGHLLDNVGVGTGFTYVMPSSNAPSYTAAKLFVDPSSGQLGIATTPGIFTGSVNTHTNVLGVGFTGQAQVTRISTRLVTPPNGSGRWEQAGLWFGYDQDHYFKVVYESSPSGNALEFFEELNGTTVRNARVAVAGTPSAVSLELIVDPYNQVVSAYYATGNNDLAQLGQPFAAPPEFFSFDAAGIDPEIGTRSFAGIFATQRNGATPLVYWFDNFSVRASSTGTPPPGPVTFNKVSHPVSNPTNMAWGPDGRLYVTEMFGRIHALTFNANLQVVQDQVINGLTNLNGSRLTLGIAVDPASTASDVRLFVASSSPSTSSGALNSGMVTKLSGLSFGTVQNVITGLPRAISNHAPNSLHFGPDGRLYIAIGGNTGTGSPVNVANEFGDRPEQWLSAAIVVADVNAPTFDGTCTPPSIYAQTPCDVALYATGLRNSYDFTFHSNGQMYATDNGLGVVGAYPPTPTPPCFGTGDATAWSQGGDNPGTQPDLLLRIESGRYYGHPNPARSECVFKDGSWQGVAPLPNYAPPLVELGDHLSANGITEYTGTAVCGAQGSLLIANYSLGQNITRVTLGQGGLSVTNVSTLVSGLAGPLAIATNPAGDIFVTELNSSLLTALRYSGPACTN